MAETKQPTTAPAAFWRGLTKPSLGGLFGSLFVCLVLIVLSVLLLDEAWLAGRGRAAFAAGPSDEFAHLTSKVLRLAHAPPSEPIVAVMGNSSIREAVASEKALREALEKRTGRVFHTATLAAGGLTPWEMVRIGDQLIGHVQGVVVMEISPAVFTRSPEGLGGSFTNPRLALVSTVLEEEARTAGIAFEERTGNYFLDNYRFFVSRPKAVLNLARPPEPAREHFTGVWGTPTKAEWERAVESLLRWRDTYGENKEFVGPILSRLIQRLKAAGLQVALVETIIDPDSMAVALAGDEERRLYEGYRDDVEAFAGANGVPYWDLNPLLETTSADYLDPRHLRTPAKRQRFTELLADRIAAMLAATNALPEDDR